MTFAARLKEQRRRLGLTQAEASVLLEIPLRTLADWERKHTTPAAICQEGALARLQKAKTPRKGSA